MIVKNESKIILRCLESVKNYIDYYVISDTGSTDGTQKIIKDYFDQFNIKGEIHQNKWINFGTNRTQAVKLAKDKADYILLIDADMTLVVNDKDFKNKLEIEMYSVEQRSGSLVYSNVRIVKGDLDYEYIGVTHEYIDCKKEGHKNQKLETIYMPDYTDGANRPDKYKRDIDLLREALKDKNLPNHLKQRYNFYLAQSYRDYKRPTNAIKYYKARAELKGWEEEVFYSLYQIGLMYLAQDNISDGMKYLLDAYNLRPTRMEPIYQLVKYFRIKGQHQIAKIFLVRGLNAKMPKDDLIFLETNIYDYLFKHELTLISYYTDDKETGRKVSEGLIHLPNVPSNIKQEVINNMMFYVKPLKDNCPSFSKRTYSINKENEKHNILNPSICYHNEQYLINTREVNYKFDIEANKYHYDGTIDTYNKIKMVTDLSFNELDTKLVDNTSTIQTYPSHITGYEDLRLVMFRDTLYAVCTSIKTNPKGVNEMCLLKFNGTTIEKIVRLKCEGLTSDEKTEKNWAPFVHDDKLLFVYSSQPTLILDCDVETGNCRVLQGGNNSLDMSTYRGGSQLVKVGDKYLYIIHQVGFMNNRRYYYHRFVQMTNELKVHRISPMFIFSDQPTIEFCSGMCYDGKQLVLTYGFEDKEAFIATIDPEEVFNFTL
jgi:predicted GH43/DUF377 family glycosyl hydrolase